jgi:hypothetical protein
VTDGIPIGCPHLLPVGTVNSAQTLKVDKVQMKCVIEVSSRVHGETVRRALEEEYGMTVQWGPTAKEVYPVSGLSGFN